MFMGKPNVNVFLPPEDKRSFIKMKNEAKNGPKFLNPMPPMGMLAPQPPQIHQMGMPPQMGMGPPMNMPAQMSMHYQMNRVPQGMPKNYPPPPPK